MCNPPGGSWRHFCPKKLYASSGDNTSKCIAGGSIKFTTLVDYIYVCAVTNAFPCNKYIFFSNVFNLNFLKFYLVKAKPIRYCMELPI